MTGCLLDTNILSELRKEKRCDEGVRQWLEGTAAEELFVSVLVLGEIRQGIERIRRRDPAQARTLEKWLLWITTEFHDHLLPVDEKVADQWGRLGRLAPPGLSRRWARAARCRRQDPADRWVLWVPPAQSCQGSRTNPVVLERLGDKKKSSTISL